MNSIKDNGDGVLAFEGEHEAQGDVDVVPRETANDGRVASDAAEERLYYEIANEDEVQEEVQQHRRLGNPVLPSQKEIDEHNVTHLPYRSWCPWCNMGRGVCTPHYSQNTESTVPRVGLDYFYLTQGEVKLRNELTEDEVKTLEEERNDGGVVKCLLVKCLESRNIFAYTIPVKGLDEDNFVVSLVVRAVQWLGHVRIIFKCDNEVSLKALVTASYNALRLKPPEELEGISRENSTKYDSKSNGATESGVRSVRGLLRTIKLELENHIGKKIPVNHPIMSWMMEHVALLLSAIVKKDDGQTPWRKVRGRPFNQPMLGFGEAVMWKQPEKGPFHNVEGNCGPVLLDGGIFLGYSRLSNTYMIGTDGGVLESRGIKRKPEPNRWNGERISALQATPWSMRTKQDTEVVFQEPSQPADQQLQSKEVMPRRYRITKTHLDVHGYTEGCPQCDWILRHGQHKPGTAHTDVCRDRVMNAIGSTDAGKAKVQAHEDRTTRQLSDVVQRAVESQQEPMPGVLGRPYVPSLPGRRADDTSAAARHIPLRDDDPFVEAAGPSGETNIDDDTPMGDDPHDSGAQMDVGQVDQQVIGYNADATASTRQMSGSAEGWLPRADEAAVPKPLGGDANMGNGTVVSQPGMSHKDRIQQRKTHGVNSRPTTPFEGMSPVKPITAAEPEAFIGHLGFMGDTDDPVCELMLHALGSGKAFTRERRAACKKMVSEVYSPPRVTKTLEKLGNTQLLPGFAFDITTMDPDTNEPWNFDDPAMRSKARKLLETQRPLFVIGSPMCRAFCTWQALNRVKHAHSDERIKREMTRATVHLDFVIELYEDQMKRGGYFLHEHPLGATSWQHDRVRRLLQRDDVQRVGSDQCQFDAEAHGKGIDGEPVKKPTGWMSNAPEVLKVLNKRCSGRGGACSRPKGGRHVLATGRIATEAAIYSDELCRSIIQGMKMQMKEDGLLHPGCLGLQAHDDEKERQDAIKRPDNGFSGTHRDDLTGQVLNDKLVQEARATEIAYFIAKGVWKQVPKTTAYQRTGRPPITVRWVDVNKGDDQNPKYRSRLVARQLKATDRSGQSFFAPAPPIEALRTVLALSQTKIGSWQPDWDPMSPNRVQVSTVDVSRAYFNAKVDEDQPCFVELPAEINAAHDMCGQLLRHMYGTRMAADGWQEEYSTLLVSFGFVQGLSCPNVFHHESRGIVCSVHGDDFTSCGSKPSLDWLENAIGASYEITIGPRLGPGPEDAKEARILNRVVRWEEGRLEYEADPRQVERLLADCGLEGCKPMVTPGARASFSELEADADLPKGLHTAFRGAAARGNYLSMDRLDAHFACKEICRWMSSPSQQSWKALKRLCRYFAGSPRLVYVYQQQSVDEVDIFTDTDWAGCPKTRKSTSGGCLMLGSHTLKHWSSTQSGVSLSSGEAEFHGVVKGAGMGLGYQALLQDLGIKASLRVWTDSSAAIGIASRQGLGKLRHLDTHTLWLQQAVRSRRLELKKVPGTANPADLLTKHSLTRDKVLELVKLFGCKFTEGRAATAPAMRAGIGLKTTMAQHHDNDDEEVYELGEDDGNDEGPEQPTIIPHLHFGRRELDTRYPSLTAPSDFDQPGSEPRDQLLEAGMQVAESIAVAMKTHGRTRRDQATDPLPVPDRPFAAARSRDRQPGNKRHNSASAITEDRGNKRHNSASAITEDRGNNLHGSVSAIMEDRDSISAITEDRDNKKGFQATCARNKMKR